MDEHKERLVFTDAERIPVHLISGFLGSGKTTLLQRLLEHCLAKGLKPAIMMNEYGEVNIDGELLRGQGFSIREMTNGCASGSRSTHSRSGLIELSGANGQLLGDHTHGFAYLIQGMQRTALPVAPPTHTVCKTIEAFVAGVQHNTPFPINVEDGLRSVAIAEACYRSAESGQMVKVEK